jgi:WD40 repeat protein
MCDAPQVHAMQWSPDGTLLATGSNDGSLRLSDPRAALEDPTLAATGMELRGHLGGLNCVRPVTPAVSGYTRKQTRYA